MEIIEIRADQCWPGIVLINGAERHVVINLSMAKFNSADPNASVVAIKTEAGVTEHVANSKVHVESVTRLARFNQSVAALPSATPIVRYRYKQELFNAVIVASPDGEYVKYSDHIAVLAAAKASDIKSSAMGGIDVNILKEAAEMLENHGHNGTAEELRSMAANVST